MVGVKGRTLVEGREGTPTAVYVTSFPGLGVEGDRGWLDAVCCEAEVICDSLFCCRGALAIEKPTSVGWIIVFTKGVSVSSRLWEVSVGGDHGVGRRHLGDPVFRQSLSRSELATRC